MFRKRPLTIGAEPEFKMMYMNKIKVYLPAALDLYPTQKLMINRILKAVGEKENALIEAPTGSGTFSKLNISLNLLIILGKTLALLSSTCSWLSDYEEKRREKRDPCPIHSAVLDETNETAIGMDEKVESMLKMETSVNADFKEPLERNSRVEDKSVDQSNVCTCRPKIRIYYCTRTHKQISQVVKEYKRLPFWRNETLK
jgi:Fanconi anemia group J protein